MNVASRSQVEPAAGAGWREFPVLERLLGSGDASSLFKSAEVTCRSLNELIQSGSEADKLRAKLALTAYGRTLDLLKHLTGLRDKAAEQS